MSDKKKSKSKEESTQQLIQNYLQAKTEGNTLQIKIHESILKRLGIKLPK